MINKCELCVIVKVKYKIFILSISIVIVYESYLCELEWCGNVYNKKEMFLIRLERWV